MTPTVALIVPTIREDRLRDFIDRWGALDLFKRVALIVVEDNPEPTFDLEKIIAPYYHLSTTHYSWKNIELELGKNGWIIPRRSDTVRSFGYLMAWKLGYDRIMTLDDDCYPCTEEDGVVYDGPGFVEDHLHRLDGKTRWHNTLNSVKPRGVPFYNVGTNKSIVLNHGLWTNVLDYDAPYQLANPIKEEFSFDNRIIPSGLYFPMCGMNLMFHQDATVLMYHLLMGQWVGPHTPKTLSKLPFDRFGDIWAGVIAKKIIDLTRQQVSSGMPYIRHERASDPFTNLKKEAPGIEVNETFWNFIDSFSGSGHWDHSRRNFCRIYDEMGSHIGRKDPDSISARYPEYAGYFETLGLAMREWASLFISRGE